MKKIHLIVLFLCALSYHGMAQTAKVAKTVKAKKGANPPQTNSMTEEELNIFLRNNYERYPKKNDPPVQRKSKDEVKKDEAVKPTLTK